MNIDEFEQSAVVMELHLASATGTLQLPETDIFNTHTVGMGHARYTSSKLWMQHASIQHHTLSLLP